MKRKIQKLHEKKKTKTNLKNGTGKLGAMSVDDFMKNGFVSSDGSENESNPEEIEDKFSVSKNRNIRDEEESSESTQNDEDILDSESELELEDEFDEAQDNNDYVGEQSEEEKEGEEDESDSNEVDDSTNITKNEKVGEGEGDWTSMNFSHKRAVANLQKTDPEFYKFLQENDKDLLDFGESDSGEEGDGGEGRLHKPPTNLEVASDESDYEEKGVKADSRVITLKLVTQWENELQKTSVNSPSTIIEIVHAFHAVVVRVSNEDDPSAKYVVTGGSVFNAVLQLCVLELQPALKKYLKIPSGGHFDPTKKKLQWTKVRKGIRLYISNLIKLLGAVTSTHILAVMLKHLHQMMPFAACFCVVHRPLLKILVNLWSTGEETVRVIAFLCILRLTTRQQDKILDKILKMMHLAYVQNCKFVSPNTLPAINFMRRSLVEMFALDVNVAYQHTFLYIRQLAIHLRNAITLHKPEHFQAVLNWQFINSVHLWSDLLGATANKPQLQSLVYPLVQVMIGTIKLTPTAQYFPLRFHCTAVLIELSKRTCTFIPILPFLLEILHTYNFNTPHQKVSMKPVKFDFILRATKQMMRENGFKDVVIDTIYQQLLQYLTNESNSIAFPDLIIPAAIQLKKFLKTCKVSNYCRKIKQLLEKIEENASMVEKERQKVTFKLGEHKSIAAWESQLQLKGTPLMNYYQSWNKVNIIKQAKQATDNDKLGDFKLPTLKKREIEEKPKSDEPVVLFPSDDSDSDTHLLNSDDNNTSKKRRKRIKKDSGKNKKLSVSLQSYDSLKTLNKDDKDDILEDLKLEDF